ncbi:helix-turn-helix transcriptional regulator [Vibrio mimicus]
MRTEQRDTSFTGTEICRMAGMESFILRQGLELQLAHVTPAATFRAEFAIQDSPIIFGFMFTGRNHCHYSEGALRDTKVTHSCGSNRITYLPETAGSMECKCGMHRLSIITSREFLDPYLSEETAKLPYVFAGALSGRKDAFQWTGQRSIRKMRLVADILTSPYSGSLRKLHMEARTLELIGLQLAEYLSTDSTILSQTLKFSDISRIKDARELLIQDMEAPPSITQLARMTGLNEKKLKCGFKQVFGVPIFEYFRHYRLEIAREMLASGLMNVTEVGTHIGYHSLSHFSEAFRKKYGVAPKMFQDKEHL